MPALGDSFSTSRIVLAQDYDNGIERLTEMMNMCGDTLRGLYES